MISIHVICCFSTRNIQPIENLKQLAVYLSLKIINERNNVKNSVESVENYSNDIIRFLKELNILVIIIKRY